MQRVFFTPFAKLFEFQPRLDYFLVLAAVIPHAVACGALKLDEIVL